MSLWPIKYCACGCGSMKYGSDYINDYDGDTEEEQQAFFDCLIRDGWMSPGTKAEDIEADDDFMITERCPSCKALLANKVLQRTAGTALQQTDNAVAAAAENRRSASLR